MDISINAKVNCSDGPFGQSICVILKPTTKEITHLVVRNDAFPETDYLVQLNRVVESTPNRILLNCSRAELSEMPVFDKVEFVPSDLTGFAGNPYWMWPYYAAAVPVPYTTTLEKDHIPADELAIRRGAKVESTNGEVGRVDEFLIDPSNDRISHLVMREGHLWGQKTVTIPVGQIDHYADNKVYLKLNKDEIEKLPSIPVRYSWEKSN